MELRKRARNVKTRSCLIKAWN